MAKHYKFPGAPVRKKKKQERKFGSDNRKKLVIIFVILLVFICILIGRLIFINLTSSDKYARIVMAQMDYDSKTIPFKRGDIRTRAEAIKSPALPGTKDMLPGVRSFTTGSSVE